MKKGFCWLAAALVLLTLMPERGRAQGLTVQTGGTAAAPTSLVQHTETWRYFKGTVAPQANWLTAADASLSGWSSGPGGFGYADNAPETSRCGTLLPDMINSYSTLFVRRSFQVTNAVDPLLHLQLTLDFDDGFVAYLDGQELQRVNAPGTVGTVPAFNATATAGHESSQGSGSPDPATTYDLGTVGNRLGVGTHVLAIVGLNNPKSSSDFVLVADLALSGTSPTATVNGAFFSLISSNSVVLSGSNTVTGSTRVTVNGDDAVVSGSAWSKTNALVPGLNLFFIAALDSTGNMLASTNRDVLSEITRTHVSGTLSGSNYWSSAMGTILLDAPLTISSGGSLTIAPGTTVLVGSGVTLTATGASLVAEGTAANPILFAPANGTTEWGPVSVSGGTSRLLCRFVESIGGRFSFANGATVLLEDSNFHHNYSGSSLLSASSAGSITMRRFHLHHYHDINLNGSLVLAEDSLYEYLDAANSDPFEMSGAPKGTIIRRVTIRDSFGANSDAFDLNSCTGVLFEDIFVDNVADKGISIGTAGGAPSTGIVVRNALIRNTRTGIALKDNSDASITNVTIVDSLYGLQLYPKYTTNSINAGGRLTNFINNILWNNATAVTLSNGFFSPTFSDFGSTNFPGAGNFSADPLFVNEAREDYRLSPASPALGSGQNGGNLGAILPVGGLPGQPLSLTVVSVVGSPPLLSWVDGSENEAGFLIERSLNARDWAPLARTAADRNQFTDETALLPQKYYYRVAATNLSGASFVSNPASGQRASPQINVGGTLSADTFWTAGTTYTVTGALTIASSATLTLQPGTLVQFNPGVLLNVNGRLLAEGSSEQPIRFTRAGAGKWGNVYFQNTTSESRLSYVQFDGAGGGVSQAIHANNAFFFLDHLSFTNVTVQYVSMDNSAFIIQNCLFPDTSGVELLHGVGLRAKGYAVIQNNFFGATTGLNDIIDFTGGQRDPNLTGPQTILQFWNNTFSKAGDDALDLDGTDAHIEGNIFLHVHQTVSTVDSSSAISGGKDGNNQSRLTIVRNLFFDCDHVALAKEGNFYTLQNNTAVRMTVGGVVFDEPGRHASDGVTPGRGAFLDGNIFWQTSPNFEDAYINDPTYGTVAVTVHHSILSGPDFRAAGTGNLGSDPLLFNTVSNTITIASIREDFRLQSGSPALGTGPNGLDMGALVPSGASLSGLPTAPTTLSNLTFTVHGPGIVAFKFKLNEGPYSSEVPITNLLSGTTLTLSNLPPGSHTLSVIGKSSAGYFQGTNNPVIPGANTPTLAHFVVQSAAPDSDGDGLEDAWEMAAFGSLVRDGSGDFDGDGLSDRQEFQAGTNPVDAGSRLEIASIVYSGDQIAARFSAVAGKSYTLQYSTSLQAGSWQKAVNVAPQAASGPVEVTYSGANGKAALFYRLVTPAVP